MSGLSEAKVGDVLLIADRWNRIGILQKIERITPKGRVITKYGEYNPDGKRRGSHGFDTVWARLATRTDIDAINRANLVEKLRRFAWDKLSADDLKIVEGIAAKYQLPAQ